MFRRNAPVQLRPGKKRHCILCLLSSCGGGDWVPLRALMEGLYHRGHTLVVVCDSGTAGGLSGFCAKDICLKEDLDLSRVFDPALARLLASAGSSVDNEANPFSLWGESAAEYVGKELGDWRPSLIVGSLFTMGLGRILSARLGAPWCLINPGCDFFSSPDRCRRDDYSPPGYMMYLHWLQPLAASADLVLHGTDPLFDCASECLLPNHRYIGPLFWERPYDTGAKTADPGLPVVLVTLSTSPQPQDLSIVRTAMAAFADFDVHLVVTVSTGHNRADYDPLPENVQISSYIPHSRVLSLASCCLVVSHCGHGIVMKSIYHGVPMVLVPWGRDQPGIAEKARRLGVASVISPQNFCVATLQESARSMWSKEHYKRSCREQMLRLRRTHSLLQATNHIEKYLEGK